MPLISDDLSHWSDIFHWRQHHYQAIVSAYEAITPTSADPQVCSLCLLTCYLSVHLIYPACKKLSDVGVVVCLQRGADCLHMVQLMPLHFKTPSSLASFKSRLVLPFWYQLSQVVLDKRPLNWCS